MNGNLERRYRRVLRLLPGYYREQWEEDMVAAFLDGWLTGDPEADEYISRVAGPSWAEIASVIGLAARQYLGGASAPRRYFAWGQAIRLAALAVALVHAVFGLDTFVRLAWGHRLFGVPAAPAILGTAPPASLSSAPTAGIWLTAAYAVAGAWIVIYLALLWGRYRAAQVLAALAVVTDLAALLQHQFTGQAAPWGFWSFWVLVDLVPALAMAAFHRDAPPAARRPWLLALPATYFLVAVPQMAIQATSHFFWLPDFSGLCCLLVAIACLAHAPRAWSQRGGDSGVWSLALTLLAAVAAVYRLVSLADYPHNPHLVHVGLAELLILVVAAALVTPDAARTQAAAPHLRAGGRNDKTTARPGKPGRAVPAFSRQSSVLAGALAAVGLVLIVTIFTEHVPPLGPEVPSPGRLAAPIVLQPVLTRAATPAGGCPAGYVTLPAPGDPSPGLCYRRFGTPVAFTYAVVLPGPVRVSAVAVPAGQPAVPGGQPAVGPGQPDSPPPATSGLLIALPFTEQAALTQVTTTAYDSRGALAMTVAGKTWALPRVTAPFTIPQFQIDWPRHQTLQLQHLLVSSG
ncbi:MAG TPA: hypothetical protein VHY58_11775 [Streptosporangiaceae bacterium]|jgi:hypothetical protein|nr:hypothetical protein [Streptosporangiaceae bacterium]